MSVFRIVLDDPIENVCIYSVVTLIMYQKLVFRVTISDSFASPATIAIPDRRLGGWLCLRRSLGHCRPKPFPDGDSDPCGNLHRRVREYRTIDACREARYQHDAARDDERRRDARHHFGMLSNEAVQCLARN